MDLNIFLDMRNDQLSLKLQLVKGRFFDAFKREKSELKAKSAENSVEEPELYLAD